MSGLVIVLNLSIGVAVLLLAVFGLRLCWAASVSPKTLGWISVPGVAVHELSHAAGCLVTGAKVNSITLFRTDGSGEVKHGPPRLRYFGEMIIAMAPLVGGAFALWLIGEALHTPVNFYRVRRLHLNIDQLSFLGTIVEMVLDDLRLAIKHIDLLDWRTYVFLYLALTIILSLAPSRQDFSNAFGGIILFAVFLVVLHLLIDLLIYSDEDGPVADLLGRLLAGIHYPLAVAAISYVICGIVYGIGALFGRKRADN